MREIISTPKKYPKNKISLLKTASNGGKGHKSMYESDDEEENMEIGGGGETKRVANDNVTLHPTVKKSIPGKLPSGAEVDVTTTGKSVGKREIVSKTMPLEKGKSTQVIKNPSTSTSTQKRKKGNDHQNLKTPKKKKTSSQKKKKSEGKGGGEDDSTVKSTNEKTKEKNKRGSSSDARNKNNNNKLKFRIPLSSTASGSDKQISKPHDGINVGAGTSSEKPKIVTKKKNIDKKDTAAEKSKRKVKNYFQPPKKRPAKQKAKKAPKSREFINEENEDEDDNYNKALIEKINKKRMERKRKAAPDAATADEKKEAAKMKRQNKKSKKKKKNTEEGRNDDDDDDDDDGYNLKRGTMKKLMRHTISKTFPDTLRISEGACQKFRESTEDYLVKMLQSGEKASGLCDRKTVDDRALNLAQHLLYKDEFKIKNPMFKRECKKRKPKSLENKKRSTVDELNNRPTPAS